MDHIRGGNQDPDELASFCAFIKDHNISRYLEIGSRNGDSFHAVMSAIGPGGYGLAVDLPEGERPKALLTDTAVELRAKGIAADIIFGDSTHRDTSEQVAANSPFDLVLIDGDHSYAGVARDWLIYSRMGRYIALHDIAVPDGYESDGRPNEVGRFWRHLKANCRKTVEIVTEGSNMGFGIVWR